MSLDLGETFSEAHDVFARLNAPVLQPGQKFKGRSYSPYNGKKDTLVNITYSQAGDQIKVDVRKPEKRRVAGHEESLHMIFKRTADNTWAESAYVSFHTSIAAGKKHLKDSETLKDASKALPATKREMLKFSDMQIRDAFVAEEYCKKKGFNDPKKIMGQVKDSVTHVRNNGNSKSYTPASLRMKHFGQAATEGAIQSVRAIPGRVQNTGKRMLQALKYKVGL